LTDRKGKTGESDESDAVDPRPILASDSPAKSDARRAFENRLLMAIGEEPVNAFARRSGIPEANIRSYLARGVSPTMDKLIAIAQAAGVTVEWLATGRGIQRAADLRKAEQAANSAAPQPSRYARRLDKIAQLIDAIEDDKEQSALVDELLSRAQEKAKMYELTQALAALRADQKKAG
jgi:transcriptional regulator with XRE-family HTH domain